MNNVARLDELRRIAIQRGFPKEIDRQFYLPVRTRVDGRSYIATNAEHAFLWNPEWVEKLVGDSYEEAMVEMARVRARRGDTVGWLYDKVMETKGDE